MVHDKVIISTCLSDATLDFRMRRPHRKIISVECLGETGRTVFFENEKRYKFTYDTPDKLELSEESIKAISEMLAVCFSDMEEDIAGGYLFWIVENRFPNSSQRDQNKIFGILKRRINKILKEHTNEFKTKKEIGRIGIS